LAQGLAARQAKRDGAKAVRLRARERWHKAMRMVSRANRVKKITGMLKYVPPAKGQSLNERLQTLEAASRKSTSAISRMENSIEALNDSVRGQPKAQARTENVNCMYRGIRCCGYSVSPPPHPPPSQALREIHVLLPRGPQVRNLVQNLTGVDEKIEKTEAKRAAAEAKLRARGAHSTLLETLRERPQTPGSPGDGSPGGGRGGGSSSGGGAPPSPGALGKALSAEALAELTQEVAAANGDVSEETAMLYAVAVQHKLESAEVREARLLAEAKNPHLRARDRWLRALKVAGSL
jgi:hypothetical protein